MTDVIILHRIPGAPAGAIREYDERMARHVAAGNARVLPNEHGAWDDGSADAAPAPVLVGASTGTFLDAFESDEAVGLDESDDAHDEEE